MLRRSLKLWVLPAALLAAVFLFSAEEANAGWGYHGGHHGHGHVGRSNFGYGGTGIHIHAGNFGFHYGSYPVYGSYNYYPRVRTYAPYYGGYGGFRGGYGCW